MKFSNFVRQVKKDLQKTAFRAFSAIDCFPAFFLCKITLDTSLRLSSLLQWQVGYLLVSYNELNRINNEAMKWHCITIWLIL